MQCKGSGSRKPEAGSWKLEAYSYLNASIGSTRGLDGGEEPKKMPILAEKPIPMANDHQGSDTGKPETQWMIADAAARRDPQQAPAEVRNAASIRNCQRISRRLAPSAFRTPISFVRSVTEIIMMAMTPMPPTISAIEEMTTSPRNVARLI